MMNLIRHLIPYLTSPYLLWTYFNTLPYSYRSLTYPHLILHILYLILYLIWPCLIFSDLMMTLPYPYHYLTHPHLILYILHLTLYFIRPHLSSPYFLWPYFNISPYPYLSLTHPHLIVYTLSLTWNPIWPYLILIFCITSPKRIFPRADKWYFAAIVHVNLHEEL